MVLGLLLALALAWASEISGHWPRWPNKAAFKCSRRSYAATAKDSAKEDSTAKRAMRSCYFLFFLIFFCTVFVGIKKDVAEIVFSFFSAAPFLQGVSNFCSSLSLKRNILI